MARRTPEDVQAALRAHGVETEVTRFDSSTATAQEAADSIGTALGRIVKSLCFLAGDEPLVVLAAGDRRVDDRKVAALYGLSRKKVRIADAETTEAATGYVPGGVPPIGHARDLPVLIDESLGRFESVFAAAGSPHAVFETTVEELARLTGGRVLDVTRE
jgi:Cys-tRNA(Pro) deacylase